MKRLYLYAAVAAGLCIGAVCINAQTITQTSDSQTNKSDDVVVLSPFLLTSDRDRGYAATTSVGASRVAVAVGDLPVSVITLNEQFLADRGAVDAMEVLTFVSGVQRGVDAQPGQEQFSLRGYAVVGINFRDGLPEVVAAADQPFDDSSAYERIEVIKGPAGTLYGTTSMGGVVNKISKWPRFKQQTLVELQAQSYDRFFRAMVDSTGPVGEKTAYRVVLSSRAGERFYDNGGPNDFSNFLAAFTRLIGGKGSENRGRVWTRFQYLNFELDRENGTQFPTGFLDPLAPTVAKKLTNPQYAVAHDSNSLPGDQNSKANVRSYEIGYEHALPELFGGDWTMRLVGRFAEGYGDKTPTYAQARPIPVNAAGQIVTYTNAQGNQVNGDSRFISADDPRVADWRAPLSVRDFFGFNKNSGAFLDLVGEFSTGPLKHTLIINTQLTRGERERAFFFWSVPNPSNATAVANSFSVINPDYSGIDLQALRANTAPSFNSFQGHAIDDGFAAGFQDNISLWDDRLIAVIGARYDNIRSTTRAYDVAQSIQQRKAIVNQASTRTFSNQDMTLKYGLVAKPMPGLSVFGQVSQTYIPVNSVSVAGTKNPNQDGEIHELGVKLDLLGSRLVATASLFDMELTNVLVNVPNPIELGGGFVAVPVGTQKTKGFELDLAYEIVRGLNLAVAYSDIDSTDSIGNAFRGVPIDPSYSVLGKYSFQEGGLKGAFAGLSWKHNGTNAGDPANTFYLDQSDVWDAFLGYGRNRWSVQLNIFNLFDTDSPISAVGDTGVFRAMPRHYRMTLRYRF